MNNDFIMIKEERLYKLIANNYIMLNYSDDPFISWEEVIEDINEKEGINFIHTYNKYGISTTLNCLGQYLYEKYEKDETV